jgi:hypothetical protein
VPRVREGEAAVSQILYQEGATPWMQHMARDILSLLDTVYPGHPWAVRVYGDEKGGGYFIQHLEFEGGQFGMNQPRAHLFASASELRLDVMRKAGELLERCSVARRRWQEQEIKKMEGVPDKFQPPQYKRELEEKQQAAVAEVVREYQHARKEEEKNGPEDGLPQAS